MKELELLTILTNVRGEYILQAQELRSGQRKQLRVMHRKRIFLIAAVISLLLLLVGCAAVLIGLQKISLGRVTFPQYSQPGWTMDLVSTNGYLDSVNYQATREWIDFITNYDADRVLEQQKDSNGYKEPEDYRIYNCYTPQMQEKVDELCEKYALQLAGPVYFTREPEQVFSAVGISSMMRKSSEDMFSLSGGSYYRSGSFNMVGMVNHCFEGRSTADSILFVYACDRKTVFFPDYVILWDMDSVDSWEYTAWDGTNLILVQSPARGVIVADVGDFFISVTLDFCYSSPEGEVDAHNPCSRKEFEWIADDFMYQIAPREPESDWLQNPNGLNAGAVSQTFADYFDHWLPGSVGSEAYSPDYQQKFVDLDEDGTDEMLIWNARTGVIYEVVTIVDGVPQCVYDSGIYGDNNQLYLCEGNILDRNCVGSVVQGNQKQLNEYYRMVDKQLLPVECIMEGNDGKFYWSENDCASSLMWREISETEYNAVRAKYVRIPGTLGSLPELSDEVKSQLKNEAESRLLQVLMDQYAFYHPDDGLEYYLTDYCRRTGDQLGFPVSITRYAFVDMDGDGTAEAVVDFKFGENEQVMCMVLKYDSGTVFGAEFYHRQMSHIKKDGSFAYSGGGDNDGWAKLRWENNTWVDEPAPDATNKEDVTWVSYPITADVHSDAAFTLFREVFMPMSEGAEKPTMENLRTLAGEAGYYVDAHYEFDFLILMPGSKLSGTQKDGLLTDMVYTLYLPTLEGNTDLYTLEVGVENLNTDSPQYCIYRPHTNPIAANSASDLAEYINWHRTQPEDSYTNWNPSMIIYECK